MEEHDVLALLPTGGGKSICFQVPGMAREGLCLVVSPLLALMKDQVENLKDKGIKATRIVSGMNKREVEIALDNCEFGDYKFLYVSPERLLSEEFIIRLRKMKLSLIAVDEAHCISQWGYDFRPAYLEIAKVRQHFPDTPVMAVTATATKTVQKDICHRLEFLNAKVFVRSFERQNLAYVVAFEEDKYGRLLKLCNNVPGTGIVYVGTRKRTREVAQYLNGHGISAEAFHAGIDRKTKNNLQDRWKNNHVRIMVSTNAFGMGIDKPDVRFVAHMDIPNEPEAYFQEAGRAGRDGMKAYAVLLFNNEDILQLEKRIEDRYPFMNEVRQVYRCLGSYHQVAYGSGEGVSIPFNFADFVRQFELSPATAIHSIRLLENQGLIAFNESLDQSSTIKLLINKDDLYSFQVKNPRYDPLFKLILRSFEGMFDQHTRIDLGLLAHRGKTEKQVIHELLLECASLDVLEYHPARKGPQLTWLVPRLNEANLTLDKQVYAERKKLAIVRSQFMKKYAESDSCRQQLLLRYFGQKSDHTCGKCDWCIVQRKALQAEENFEYVSNKIDGLIQESAMSPAEIASQFSKTDQPLVERALQWKLDNQYLVYNDLEKLIAGPTK